MLIIFYAVVGAISYCIFLEKFSLVGILVGAVSAIAFSHMMHGIKDEEKTKFLGVWMIPYFLLLVRDMIISTFKIAISVFQQKLPRISILHLKANVQSQEKVLVSNSITLTPSTVTLDQKQEKYIVLYMNLSEESHELQHVSGEFEDRIKTGRITA